jgi:3-oxoacyl-[acyl-carrier protein] reductase
MIDPALQNKVVLITGANHRIGAATARTLALQGASIFIIYLRLPPLGTPNEQAEEGDMHGPGLALYNFRRSQTADEVIGQIRAQGGTVEALEADLTDLKTIPLLFDRAEAAFSPVDILINNADYGLADIFLPPSQQEGAMTPAGYAQPFITAASHDAHFAVNSRAAASELGGYGITVNMVSPGPVQTGSITPELEQRLNLEIPLGRIGQPEEVTDVVAFLASEQARWLTGQLLFVGGGHRMI